VSIKSLTWLERISGWLFTLLPHHLISRTVYFLTRRKGPLVTPAVRWFIKVFKVDMSDAVIDNISHYPTFNEFFVRALKPEARPFSSDEKALTSPVDGTVSQCGDIVFNHLFQAKGQFYALEELLAGDQALTAQFSSGRFATIYLAPYNYHRIHMPVEGRLKKMTHVPGRLFSVAPWTVRAIPRLFARNERLICLFDTSIGPMAMILVGAINVAAIETVWSGLVTPPRGKKVSHFDYNHTRKILAKGAEMGRFNMGSTVILLTSSKIQWTNLMKPQQTLKMGQTIATVGT
jgi:phosphatidylserine decarboxylase